MHCDESAPEERRRNSAGTATTSEEFGKRALGKVLIKRFGILQPSRFMKRFCQIYARL